MVICHLCFGIYVLVTLIPNALTVTSGNVIFGGLEPGYSPAVRAAARTGTAWCAVSYEACAALLADVHFLSCKHNDLRHGRFSFLKNKKCAYRSKRIKTQTSIVAKLIKLQNGIIQSYKKRNLHFIKFELFV